MFPTFKSVAEFVKHVGDEAKAIEMINAYCSNLNYRNTYNKRKNAAMQIAKNDPRFKALLAEATKSVRSNS